MTTEKPRFILTLPPYLKEKLERIANARQCSQAEVIKYALILMPEDADPTRQPSTHESPQPPKDEGGR